MSLKKLAIRFSIIFIIVALMLPSFITRIENEGKNNDVVLALNYNNFKDSLSAEAFEKNLKESKETGINTVIISEESINTLVLRGDISAFSVSKLKERFDSESEEIVERIENDKKICPDSYVLITKREQSSEFLKYWIPKKYTKDEFLNFETSQGATVFILYKEIKTPGLEPIGFKEESIIKAKENNFDVALVMMASKNSTIDYIKSINELVKKYKINYISLKKNSSYALPNENEEKTIKAFCKLIEDNKLTLIVTENSDQLSNQKPYGYSDYIKSAKGRVMRCYETGGERVDDEEVTESRYFKMLNSVIDRNARFITLNVINVDKGTIKEKSEKTIEATKLLINKLNEFGYNIQGFDTQLDGYNTASRKIFALSLILMLLMWLLMAELLWNKPFKKLEIAALIMILPSVVFTMTMPQSIVDLYATVFAITAPCFCITVVMYSVKQLKDKLSFIWLLLVSAVEAIAVIGFCGIVQSVLLSGLDYYINTLIFRGIKISLMLPIVYSVIACFIMNKKDNNIVKKIVGFINSEIKVSWVIIGAAVVVVAGTYLKRSGNVTEISTLEAIMRNTITNLMEARPRTKEFLIGWPALALFVYYIKNTDWKFMQWVTAVLSSILFASGINSFCHVFTPASIIYMRVINGFVIGVFVSVAALILNLIFVKIVKYIIKAGKKNGILPY